MSRTSFQAHARLQRKIINMDRAAIGVARPYNMCMWDECDRDSTSLYEKPYCEHDVRLGCEQADRIFIAAGAGRTAHTMMAFCSQRHLEYWFNATGGRALKSIDESGRAYGNLPAGSRTRFG